MAGWSTLYCDVLGEILLRIEGLVGFLHSSFVCRSWNHAFSIVKRKWRSSMPYLLLAENNQDNPDCARNIYDLSRNKCYQLRLPETFGARCWGSQYGWIVTLDLDRQIHMFNPLTKARVRLPPQSTMPNQLVTLTAENLKITAENLKNGEDHIVLNTLKNRDIFITNVLVIKDDESESNDDFVVLAIVGGWDRSLAFARPGDESWTAIDPPEYTTQDEWTYLPTGSLPPRLLALVPHVVPFRERALDFVVTGTRVVVLYLDLSLGYLDISDLRKSNISRQQSLRVKKLLLDIPKGLMNTISTRQNSKYLITDSLGDLLMVIRLKQLPYIKCETTGFEVYKLNQGTKEWERLDNLGDIALFVGVGNSLSVCAPESGNFRSNCIYFTDDYRSDWKRKDIGGLDMGVFDLESKQIEEFYKGDDKYSKFCPPLWFMPLL